MSSRSTLIHSVTRAGIGLGALFVVGVLLAAIPNHRPPVVVTTAVNAEQESQASRQTLIELQQKVASAQHKLRRAAGGRGVTESLPTTRPSSFPTSPSTLRGQS